MSLKALAKKIDLFIKYIVSYLAKAYTELVIDPPAKTGGN